ncbi:MAG: LamG-like jellyroll fold domain-containing protein [bacterium]|nr:LamG-like jellyroll fold domain-containing protein [bacterium]
MMKRIRMLACIICGFGLLLVSPVWGTDINKDAVGIWKIDKGEGTTLKDSSGNGNNGTIKGATWVKEGSGWALSFDGRDDSVEVQDAPSLRLQPPYTMGVWFKTTSSNDGMFLIGKSRGYAYCLFITRQSKYLSNNMRATDDKVYNIAHVLKEENETFADDIWHFVIGTVEKGKIKLFIDGELKGEREYPEELSVLHSENTALSLVMGRWAKAYYQGMIGEAFILKRAMTKEEIKILFEEEKKKYRGISLRKTSDKPVIDGKLTDTCWQNQRPLTNFYLNNIGIELAKKQTTAYLTYDDKNIYVGYRCQEPQMAGIKAHIADHDGPVSRDDCVEFFVSPKGEDDYVYYQFILNTNNALFDQKIAWNVEHWDNPFYEFDSSWNCKGLKSAIYSGQDYWSAEIAIPFSELGGIPKPGDKWRLNLAREETQSGELSTFSSLVGGFHQPKHFSRIDFEDNIAILTRAKKQFFDTLTVKRERPLYKELLTDKPGSYIVHNWQHWGSESAMKKYKLTMDEWIKMRFERMEEEAKIGMMGTCLPWSLRGRTPCDTHKTRLELHQKYGAMVNAQFASQDGWCLRQKALKEGAVLQNQGEPYHVHESCSILDPVYVKLLKKSLTDYAYKYKDLPYLYAWEGEDEPTFPLYRGDINTAPDLIKKWNKEVKNNYGFGKYEMPKWKKSRWARPMAGEVFSYIAYNRWAAQKYLERNKELYQIAKRITPNIKFCAGNLGTIHGIDTFDHIGIAEYSDIMMNDPYASAEAGGRGRGTFNHGFATKLTYDLSNGKDVWTIIQAFTHYGFKATPDRLREWVSQSLKNGAKVIDYLEDDDCLSNKPLYQEMLRLAGIITKMNKIRIPKDSDTAILYPYYSSFADGRFTNADEVYTAYSLLGERIGSWFTFISDFQIEKGQKKLSDYKVIYIPRGDYLTEEIAKKIEDYVRNGGIVVAGDPGIFNWNINGESLANYRERIFGVKVRNKIQSKEMIVNGKKLPVYMDNDASSSNFYRSYPVYKIEVVGSKAKVTGYLENGIPGVVENKYGKGRVIYFAVNPFIPRAVFEPAWSDFFREIQTTAGCKIDQDIWNFELHGN